jgi:DNA-binding GntR family transcriptional regulator
MSVDPLPVRSDLGARRQQLPDEVASYVRELIISGQMRPGAFLRMDRIAEAVGVSNTPVREGLLILSSEGFVSQVPRRGYVVAPFTRQDVRDLFWAQATLAGELAARAAKKIGREQLARAEDIMARYEVASEAKDEQGLADLGHAFHREINLAADSLRLANLLGSVVKQLPQRFYATIEGGVDAARVEHPLIIEALRKRDARKARSLMEQHISHGADRLIESLKQRGLWAELPGTGLRRPSH